MRHLVELGPTAPPTPPGRERGGLSHTIPRDPFPFFRHLTLAEIAELEVLEGRAKNGRLKISGWGRLVSLRKRKIKPGLMRLPEPTGAGSTAE